MRNLCNYATMFDVEDMQLKWYTWNLKGSGTTNFGRRGFHGFSESYRVARNGFVPKATILATNKITNTSQIQ